MVRQLKSRLARLKMGIEMGKRYGFSLQSKLGKVSDEYEDDYTDTETEEDTKTKVSNILFLVAMLVAISYLSIIFMYRLGNVNTGATVSLFEMIKNILG